MNDIQLHFGPTSELRTHISNLAEACNAMNVWASSETAISITDALNAKNDAIIAQMQNMVNCLYRGYQVVVDKIATAPVELEWSLLSTVTMDDAPTVLEDIRHSIEKIPVSLSAIIAEVANIDAHDINNLLRDINISPLTSAMSALAATFTVKCAFDSGDIDTATLDLLNAAATMFDDAQFEHTMCLNEYVDSLARIESVTSALRAQLHKIACFPSAPTGEAAAEDVRALTVAVQNMTASVDGMGGALNEEHCVMNSLFLDKIRIIYTEMRACMDTVERLYVSCFNEPSDVSLFQENVEHGVADVPSILEKVEEDIAAIFISIPNIFNRFGQNYEQHVGTELFNLQAAIVSLMNSCIADGDASLLQRLSLYGNTFCVHKGLTVSSHVRNILQHLGDFPIMNKELCCSYVFTEMRDIHHYCFKMLRLLKTIIEADIMYAPNKHDTWKSVIATIKTFFDAITINDAISFVREDGNNWCYSIKLKEYLAFVRDQFATMTTSLDTTIVSLDLPKFVPDFVINYSNIGCDVLTFFLNNIAQVVANIDALIPILSQKFDQSSYTVDTELQEAATALPSCIRGMLSKIGNEIPLLSTLCKTCENSNEVTLICNNAFNLANSIENISQLLLQHLCCRDPVVPMFDIAQTLQRIQHVIERTDVEASNVSPDGAHLITAQFTHGTEVLSHILAQIADMERAPTPDDSPCPIRRTMQNAREIEAQIRNLLDVTIRIQEVVGGPAIDFDSITALAIMDAGYCARLEHMYGTVAGLLGDVYTATQGVVSKLSARSRAIYSDALLASVTNFSDVMFQISSQVSHLNSVTTHVCGVHNSFSQIITEINDPHKAMLLVTSAVKKFCCSSISESFYISSHKLLQIEQCIIALSNNHAIDTALDDLSAFTLLSSYCKQAKTLSDAIFAAGSAMTGGACNFQDISVQFAAFAHTLSQQSDALVTTCEALGCDDITKIVQSPATFTCDTAALHAEAMAHAYIQCQTRLAQLAATIRDLPPLRANFIEVLELVSDARDMFNSFGGVIVFLMEKYQTPSFLCDACAALVSPPSVAPEWGVDSFNDMHDVLSHPGCCTYAGDELIVNVNLIKNIEHQLYLLTQLDRIMLHPSREDVFLQNWGELLTSVASLKAQITSLKSQTLPQSYCISHSLIPIFKDIAAALQTVGTYTSKMAQLLGATVDYSSVAYLTKDRTRPGCEMFAVAVEYGVASMQQSVRHVRTICEMLLQAKTRKHNVSLIDVFPAMAAVLLEIRSDLIDIRDVVALQHLCDFCDLPRVRQAVGTLTQEFTLFVGTCTDKSPQSINGILDRYCSSNANDAAMQVIWRMRDIQAMIHAVAENDGVFEYSLNDAILPCLDKFIAPYVAFKQALLSIEATQCGTPEQVATVRSIDCALAEVQDRLREIVSFVGCDANPARDEFPTLYQAVPVVASLGSQILRQISDSVLQIVFKMQQKQVIFANNPNVVKFIEDLLTVDLGPGILHTYASYTCVYCDYNGVALAAEFKRLDECITSLKNAFLFPTIFLALEDVSLDIAIKSTEIIDMCSQFLSNASVMLQVNDKIIELAHNLSVMLSEVNTFVSSVLINEIESIDYVKRLHDNAVVVLHDVAIGFLEEFDTSWYSSANASVLKEITLKNKICLFFSAIGSINTFIARILNITKKIKVVTYHQGLVDAFKDIANAANTTPVREAGIFPGAIFSETGFVQLAETLRSVKDNSTNIATELERKCCTEFFSEGRILLHELRRLSHYLGNTVYAPNYNSMLLNPDAMHELLEYLCESQGLPAVLQELEVLSQLSNTSDASCYTGSLVPTIHNLSGIAERVVTKCNTFYLDHGLGLGIDDLPPPSAGTIECPSSFISEVIDTLRDLNIIMEYLNSIRFAPIYRLNSELQKFEAMFLLLSQIADAIENFSKQDLVMCQRCDTWPKVSIYAISSLIRPRIVEIIPDVVVNCCASFVREEHILATRAEQFELAHDDLLSCLEGKITTDGIGIPDSDVDEFANVVQSMSVYCASIGDSIHEMGKLVQQYAERKEVCLAAVCLPQLRTTNGAMLDLLRFILSAKGEAAVQVPTFDSEFDCQHRSHEIERLVAVFSKVLAKWSHFKDSFLTVNVIQSHYALSCATQAFTTAIIDLRSALSQWKDANYDDTQGVFCKLCSEDLVPMDTFDEVMDVETMTPMLQNIITHSDTRCSSILQLVASHISHNMQVAAALLNENSEEGRFLQVIDNVDEFCANLLVISKGIVSSVLAIKDFTTTKTCPSIDLNPILMQLDSVVQQLCAMFPWSSANRDMTFPPLCELNEEVLGLADSLSLLSDAWNAFCCAIDAFMPDRLRISVANSMKLLNNDFVTLYDNIPSLCILMNINFCGGIVLTVDISRTAMTIIQRIISRTSRLLLSLWSYNCCDAHAKCIYNVNQYLGQILTFTTTKEGGTQLLTVGMDTFSKCLRSVSRTICSMQGRVNVTMSEVKNPHCIFEYMSQEFVDITSSIKTVASFLNPDAEYLDWDMVTSSTKNDCHSLSDLYQDLLSKTQQVLDVLVGHVIGEDSSLIIGVTSGLNAVQNALEDAMQTLQRCEVSQGALCQSCQHRSVVCGIEQMINVLNMANQRLNLAIMNPTLQHTKNTYARSLQTVEGYLGNAGVGGEWEQLDTMRARALVANVQMRELARALKRQYQPATLQKVQDIHPG
jgi:hypothetical protein